MNSVISSSATLSYDFQDVSSSDLKISNLSQADINTPYTIKGIQTDDADLKDFLFTLGCYEGEVVTVISILAENFVISVKDARYSIDSDLAEAINV